MIDNKHPMLEIRTWLLWSLLTTLGGMLPIPFMVPLFQCLVLRSLVPAETSKLFIKWFIFSGLLSVFWSFYYFLTFGFSHEYTNFQSEIFDTPEFWGWTLYLSRDAAIAGSIIGLVQGALFIKYYKNGPTLFLWAIANSIAWGIGYPVGLKFVGSVLYKLHLGAEEFILTWGATYCIIGMITGAILAWCLKERC